MQEFDYSNETSNDLYDAVDGLSYEEAGSAKADIEKIKEAGYDVTTPVIVSNTDQYAIVEKTATGEVTKESNLIKVQ